MLCKISEAIYVTLHSAQQNEGQKEPRSDFSGRGFKYIPLFCFHRQ